MENILTSLTFRKINIFELHNESLIHGAKVAMLFLLEVRLIVKFTWQDYSFFIRIAESVLVYYSKKVMNQLYILFVGRQNKFQASFLCCQRVTIPMSVVVPQWLLGLLVLEPDLK